MAATHFSRVADDRWDIPDILLVPLQSLRAYFRQIQHIPILGAVEEASLGAAIQAGNNNAAIRLTIHNLRYAAYLARKWEGPGNETIWSLGDGVQAANQGLWIAAKRYDPALARFTTYATGWIRESWTRDRTKFMGQVRFPRGTLSKCHACPPIKETWTVHKNTESTPRNPASPRVWHPSRVKFAQQWPGFNTLAPTNRYGTVISDDDLIGEALRRQGQHEVVNALLSELKPQEATVLRLRFGLSSSPMTLQDIGKLLHLSRERVRQIETKALRTLRQWAARHRDEPILDWIRD